MVAGQTLTEATLLACQPGFRRSSQASSSDELRSLIAADMAVESVEVPRDAEKEGVLVLRGRLLRPSHEVFPRWLATLNELGYTPMLRPAATRTIPTTWWCACLPGRGAQGQVAGVDQRRALCADADQHALCRRVVQRRRATPVQSPWDFISPGFLLSGLPFAATLLGILAAHEFGHYFAARYHKVAVTLPYFIPMPLTFGTLGAFIQLKEPVPDRRKLFDIGVAGPLAGLVLAVPLLVCRAVPPASLGQLPAPGGYMMEGNSILYYRPS